jgi:adenylate cyclase
MVRAALPNDARVVKDLGDGLMLWFPEAVSALGSCLAVADRFEEEAATDVPLWVRVGMHWGCPTRRGDDLVGHDVNLAARIVDVAGPGEVLLSEPLCALVHGRVPGLQLDELGPVVMKGIPDAVALYRAALE